MQENAETNLTNDDANELSVFLDLLHAEPDNVENRLIFADWLEGQGDPRATLVRHWADPATYSLANPVADSAKLVEELYQPIPGGRLGDWIGGFATFIRVNYVSILEQSQAIFPMMTHLRHLRVDICTGDDMEALSEFILRHNIVWLDISNCRFESEQLRYMIDSGNFRNLTRLDFPRTRFPANELKNFLDPSRFPEMKQVRVSKSNYSKAFRRRTGNQMIGRKTPLFPETRVGRLHSEPPSFLIGEGTPKTEDVSSWIRRLWDNIRDL